MNQISKTMFILIARQHNYMALLSCVAAASALYYRPASLMMSVHGASSGGEIRDVR